jgi:hypothetical protein
VAVGDQVRFLKGNSQKKLFGYTAATLQLARAWIAFHVEDIAVVLS